MRNEIKGFVVFFNFFISLGNSVDVYRVIIGFYCEIRIIWRKFYFMNDFFSIFDMNYFCYIFIRIKSKVISSKFRNRNFKLYFKVCALEKKLF